MDRNPRGRDDDRAEVATLAALLREAADDARRYMEAVRHIAPDR